MTMPLISAQDMVLRVCGLRLIYFAFCAHPLLFSVFLLPQFYLPNLQSCFIHACKVMNHIEGDF